MLWVLYLSQVAGTHICDELLLNSHNHVILKSKQFYFSFGLCCLLERFGPGSKLKELFMFKNFFFLKKKELICLSNKILKITLKY